ncbi:unnamed protein product [Clonostachys rosea]|uniref:F-box domain-containing protein n=1 Tax=Bionectria ochroleuca TaxID=29856 RepID=A0ABY6U934_BIOOC|nr:unnamed protein product [Clonostachys rosea]
MDSLNDTGASLQSGALSQLPLELLQGIVAYMPNRDIKNLRLTSSYMREVAPLRFDRVFLSVDPRDVEVFVAVAKHDVFRQQITEIIYDDAPFVGPAASGEIDCDFIDSEAGKAWFERGYKNSLQTIREYKGFFIERPIDVQIAKQLTARMTPRASYQYIKDVVKQQQHQRPSTELRREVQALREGLGRFTNLRRITVTPFAHGLPFKPRYETPLIRSLPYGLIYPIPFRKSVPGRVASSCELYEKVKKPRGFRNLIQELAKHDHNIVELVVENNQLRTGIPWALISRPGVIYESLFALLSSPGFSRIDLPLWSGRGGTRLWQPKEVNDLRAALGKGVNLQHVTFSTDLTPLDENVVESAPEAGREYFIPLQSIFPVRQWPHLRHFGLSRFIVLQQDIFALLSVLPSTIRSVELSYLYFLPNGGNYRDLLYDIKQELNWVHRLPGVRPELTIYLDMDPFKPGLFVDLSKEANHYLYHGDVNPFGHESEPPRERPCRDDGIGMQRDSFQPENDVPYMQPEHLQEMGIYILDKLSALR